jgi:hypothetical protein
MLRVAGNEPRPWIVMLRREGDKVHVFLSEQPPEIELPGRPFIPRLTQGPLVKPKKLGKTIEKMQAKADQKNEAEAKAWHAMKVAEATDTMMTNVKNSWHGRKGWNDESDD